MLGCTMRHHGTYTPEAPSWREAVEGYTEGQAVEGEQADRIVRRARQSGGASVVTTTDHTPGKRLTGGGRVAQASHMTTTTWNDRFDPTSTYHRGVTAWTYKVQTENRIDGAPIVGDDGRHELRFSGMSPTTDAEVRFDLERYGHVILVNDYARGARPTNHRMIGTGVGHDDARFSESGESMAAYYESGEAFRGETWWTDPSEAKFSPIRAYYDRHHPDFYAKTGHSAP